MPARVSNQHLVAVRVDDDVVVLQESLLEAGNELSPMTIIERRARQWNDARTAHVAGATVVRSVINDEQGGAWTMSPVMPQPDRQDHPLIVRHGNDRYVGHPISPRSMSLSTLSTFRS